MIVKEAYFRGFRNFKDEVTLGFGTGYNLFLGPNGMGKSTVLAYIDLNLLNLTVKDTTLADNINDESLGFESYLTFEHLGVTYKSYLDVKMTGKTPETARSIEVGGEVLYEGTTSCTTFLATLFDPALTKYALAIRQGELEVITCKPAERFQLFQKVLDSKFNEGIEFAERDIKLLKDKISNLEGQILAYQTKEYTPKDLFDLTYTTDDVLQMKSSLAKMKEDLVLQNSLKDLHESLTKDCESVTTRLTDITTNITRKTRVNSAASAGIKTATEIEDELAPLQEDVATLNYQMGIKPVEEFISEAMKGFTVELDTAKSKVSLEEATLQNFPRVRAVTDNLETLAEERQAAVNKTITLAAKIGPLEDNIAHQSRGTCSECGAQVDVSKVPALKEELASLREQVASLNEVADQSAIAYRDKDKALKEYTLHTSNKLACQQRLAAAKTVLESVTSKETLIKSGAVEAFNKKEDSTKANLKLKEQELVSERARLTQESEAKAAQVASTLEDIQSLEEDKTLAQAELAQKEAALENAVIPDVETLNEAVALVNAKLTKHAEELETLNATVATNALLVEQKALDDKTVNDLELKKVATQKKHVLATEAKKIFAKALPQFIIAETVQGLTNAINNFVEDVYNRPLDIILKDTSTSLKMLARGKSVATLSGAEKVITCLGFLDALRGVSDLGDGLVILDEVDAFIDHTTSLSLFEAIENLPYEQIFLVTHSSPMKEYFVNKGAKSFNFSPNKTVEVL